LFHHFRSMAPPPTASTWPGVVRGAADAVALFVMGRVTETGDQLAVEPDELMTDSRRCSPARDASTTDTTGSTADGRC
jgi:hypothetical protein